MIRAGRAGDRLLQRLQHLCQAASFRFVEQQMNVLGHDLLTTHNSAGRLRTSPLKPKNGLNRLPGQIPTLNFAKDAKFRMGQAAKPGTLLLWYDNTSLTR